MEKTDQGIKKYYKLANKLIHGFLLWSAFLLFSAPAEAIIIISDEETEQYLYNISKPLFRAANVAINPNKIFIVQDDSLNAFVADGNNLFVHTGTIKAADNGNELSGVIAHEIGHIAGGHILSGKIQAKEIQQMSLASMILAGAAAVASGRGDVALAVALGGQSSALHGFLTYRTEQERSADEAAIQYLRKTNQSPQGLLDFMKKIRQRNQMSGVEENPYFRTHPITTERVGFLEKAVAESTAPATNVYDKDFARVKAKISAYLDDPKNTFRKYPLGNNSVPARYAQAIAYFKDLKIQQAITVIDKLIAEEPNNPHFRELKGQIYMETGKVKQAKQEYQKALELMPDSALFQINWAQAALEDNPTKSELQKAVDLLNKSIIKRPYGFSWLLLSRAYNGLGDEAYSNYAAAEYSLYIGAIDVAKQQAKNANKLNKGNAKLKLKTNDLLDRISLLDKNQPVM